MGDYNVNTKCEIIGTTILTQQFSNIFSSHQFKKLITLSTREQGNTSTQIDNIYSSDPQKGQSGVFKWDTTDHYLIFTVRHRTEIKPIDEYRLKRNYDIKNISKFRKILAMKSWFEMCDFKDVDIAFTYFIDFVKHNYDEKFPLKKVKIKYSNRNEWISDELKAEIKLREKLLKLKKKNPTAENIANYNKLKNKNLSNQRKAERFFYQQQFELHENDLRKSWQVIKTIIGRGDRLKVKENIDFIVDEKLVSDVSEIANTFNEYFVTVGSVLENSITSTIDPLVYVVSNVNTINIPYICREEIATIIKGLKNSSAGADELLPSIMKQCSDLYIHPLTHLINVSLKQGVFPQELKLAKVLPIYKSGNKQLIQNYRPISILPYFSKNLEKVVTNYIIDFLEMHDILYNSDLEEITQLATL